MRARSSIPALACVLWAAATACDTSPTGMLAPGAAAHLIVAPTAATLQVGAKLRLTLNAYDEEGQTARPSEVAWTTSDPRIASVSADGVVTAGGAGNAEITASWSGVRGSSSLTVTTGAGEPSCGGGGGGDKAADLSLKPVCVPK